MDGWISVWTDFLKKFIAFFSKIIAKLTMVIGYIVVTIPHVTYFYLTMVISFVLTTNHLHVSLPT
jgi:hypothetical protein